MNRRILNNWNVYTAAAKVPGELEMEVSVLDTYYSEPGRYYHSWDHIIHCVTLLRNNLDLATDAVAVETALWFHDLIYTPGSASNERDSAEIAMDFCRRAGFCEARRESVEEHIMATAGHTSCERHSADTDLVLDIDLSVLGSESATYNAYERGIRMEYAHMDEGSFATGRVAILNSLLNKAHIYRTPRFRELYEETARENLVRAVALL